MEKQISLVKKYNMINDYARKNYEDTKVEILSDEIVITIWDFTDRYTTISISKDYINKAPIKILYDIISR